MPIPACRHRGGLHRGRTNDSVDTAPPAIAKHLAVLLDATPQPFLDTGAWLTARAGAWDARLAVIKAFAETGPG